MDDSIDDFYLMDSPLLKLLLMEGGKTTQVNELLARRKEKGEHRMLFKDLCTNPQKFLEYFRMTPETYKYLLQGVEENISKYSNFRDCISGEERLAITLRFLSTGMSFRGLSFSYRISHCAIRSIVYETCQAIWDVFYKKHMHLPTTDEWKTIASDFNKKWNFPNCIGCIDGKHVRIKCPKKTGSIFHNYKGYYSIVLQGIADANYRFIAVEVGAYGKQSDGGTFSDSNVYKLLECNTFNIPTHDNIPCTDISVPYVLLGDDAYPLKTYLLKPYSRMNLTVEERIFQLQIVTSKTVCRMCLWNSDSKVEMLENRIANASNKS